MGKRELRSGRSAGQLLAFTSVLVPALVIATIAVSGDPRGRSVGSALAPADAASHTAADTTSTPDPGLAADTEVCLAVSASVEDAARVVEAHDRLPRSTFVARLLSTEAAIARHSDAVDPRLGTATRAMQEAITGLRHAAENGAAIAAATDVVLARVDDLDAACRTRLR